jgi:hypothetical protein
VAWITDQLEIGKKLVVMFVHTQEETQRKSVALLTMVFVQDVELG